MNAFPLAAVLLKFRLCTYFEGKAEVARFLNRLEGREKKTSSSDVLCSLVASHDERGMGWLAHPGRRCFGPLGDIQYAGRFRNNTNTLQVNFDDDINSFLAHCSFNICLENTSSPGYKLRNCFKHFYKDPFHYWGQ